VLSTIVEWIVLQKPTNPEVIHFWFSRIVSNVDKAVVLPALTAVIVSGMAQATIDYGSMGASPLHIRVAIHIFATFALWWGLTDLTTQHAAQSSISEWYKQYLSGDQTGLPKVALFRRWSNVVSCLFVGILYAFMALKPGYIAV